MTSWFQLQFSTGDSVVVHGTGLIGRAPAMQPGEYFDLLVPVYDPTKSMSKTHLEFGQEDEWFWVSDRWSGNGTFVRPADGTIKRCEPGRRVRVERGERVDMGDQFFTLS